MPKCIECNQKIKYKWLLFSSLNNTYTCNNCGAKYKWNSYRTTLTLVLCVSFIPLLVLSNLLGISCVIIFYIPIGLLFLALMPGQYTKQ